MALYDFPPPEDPLNNNVSKTSNGKIIMKVNLTWEKGNFVWETAFLW